MGWAAVPLLSSTAKRTILQTVTSWRQTCAPKQGNIPPVLGSPRIGARRPTERVQLCIQHRPRPHTARPRPIIVAGVRPGRNSRHLVSRCVFVRSCSLRSTSTVAAASDWVTQRHAIVTHSCRWFSTHENVVLCVQLKHVVVVGTWWLSDSPSLSTLQLLPFMVRAQ